MMENPDNALPPERLNEEGFAGFGERAGDGTPVVMLNLLAFRPDGGREIGHLRTEALTRGELHPLDTPGQVPQ
jgi:hypothetical protein